MIRREPTPETFRIERLLRDARMNAMLGLHQRNFGSLAKDPFELAHERWMNFCKTNGLSFIPEALGY